MRYVAVIWRHNFSEEPVELFSELDDDGFEVRKVERYTDGKLGYADSLRSSGDSFLSTEPLPTLAEIAADPQFEPREIGKSEFEAIWTKAAGPSR